MNPGRIAARLGGAIGASCTLVFSACLGDATGPSTPGLPPPSYDGGDFPQSVRLNGVTRTFLVHVPAAATPDRPAPLLIVYHGAGQTGSQIRTLSGLDELTDPGGWITVYPDGFLRGWAVGSVTGPDLAGVDDVAFTRLIVQFVASNLTVDPGRIYAAGFSNGAMLTHLLACRAADLVDAIASVGATMLQNVGDSCAPAEPVAALFFHGTEDESFPPDGRIGGPGLVLTGIDETVARWAELNGCDLAPAVEAIPDAADDGTTVERRTFAGCASGGGVSFYEIAGGGHTWPGRPLLSAELGRTTEDISAGAEMLAFFAAITGS